MVSQDRADKALRIGVVFDGELVYEEVYAEARSLDIGYQPGCGIEVPWAAGVSKRPFFELRDGVWHVRVGREMTGKLTREGKSHDVAQVRDGAKAKGVADGNDILLKLDPTASGRIRIGETTVLFQFVPKPAPVPKPGVFAVGMRDLSRNLDWRLVNLLLASLIVQLGVVLAGVSQYVPPKNELPPLPTRVEIITAKLEDEPPPPKEEDPKPEDPKPEDPKEAPKEATAPKEAPPPDPAKVKQQQQDRVAKQTIIRYFATTGGDSNLVIDSSMTRRLDQAFDGAPGIVGDSGESRPNGKLVTLNDAPPVLTGIDEGELAGKPTGPVASGQKAPEAQVKSRVKADAASEVFGTGKLDKNEVANVFRRRIGAVKACYERELKANPTVAGKIVVQFTIEEGGRVTDARVTSDSTGQDRIGRCILGQINAWRFPKPDGGSVTVSYPLVFQPAS